VETEPDLFRACAPIRAFLDADPPHQPPDECAAAIECPVLPKPPCVLGPCPTDGTDVWLCDGENTPYRPDGCCVEDEPWP
jgi:hypothetical protein